MSLSPALNGKVVLKPGKTFTPTNYTVVRDFFIQDSPTFNGSNYDPLVDNFGLLDKSPERWAKFIDQLESLNREADQHSTYKLLIVARHGQGFHNVAETKYGTSAWNAYWSRLTTDGDIVWGPDPQLTETGIGQAKAVNQAWKGEIGAGAPVPSTLYSSPLSRSAKTLELTWRDILIEPHGMSPLIKENLRETIGLHTCDQRADKTEIAAKFPLFHFERPFSEHDQLWSPDYEEVGIQQALRTQQVLNQIFATDAGTVLCITAHGGTIASVFNVVGHQLHPVQPGQLVPMVVKATSDPSATNRLFAGGQSVSAPPLPAKPTSVPQVARKVVDL